MIRIDKQSSTVMQCVISGLRNGCPFLHNSHHHLLNRPFEAKDYTRHSKTSVKSTESIVHHRENISQKWIHHGFTKVSPWIHQGFTMDKSLVCQGTVGTVFRPWCCWTSFVQCCPRLRACHPTSSATGGASPFNQRPSIEMC